VPVESVVRDYQQDYYLALQQSGSDGESTVFIEFMLEVILKSIQEILIDTDQATDQVTDQVKRLISVVGGKWISSTDIMHKLKLSHKPTFRKNYLKPAMELKLIVMKYPNTPSSPKQQYKRT